MAKIQKTLTLEPTAGFQYHRPNTGLTVYAYNANLNSGVDQLLTESGVSGVYKNASVDAGSYQLWIGGTHLTGTRYPELEPLIAEEISKEGLKDGAVDNDKLAADAVDGTKIADDAVDTEHIAADAVENEQASADAVDTEQIANGAVTNLKMADNSVDSDQYVNGSIDLEHLSGSVYSAAGAAGQLVMRTNDGSLVGTDMIATGALTLSNSSELKTMSQIVSVSTGISGNAAFDIEFSEVSSYDRIIGICLRVDAELGQRWSAAYSVGSSQAICDNKLSAPNTKANMFYSNTDSDIVSTLGAGTFTVEITADSGVFSAGGISAIVFFQKIEGLPDITP